MLERVKEWRRNRARWRAVKAASCLAESYGLDFRALDDITNHMLAAVRLRSAEQQSAGKTPAAS